MKDLILYRCKKCGCVFGVEAKFIHYAEKEYRYLTCPLHGKHDDINVIGREEIKYIMEERRAVNL